MHAAFDKAAADYREFASLLAADRQIIGGKYGDLGVTQDVLAQASRLQTASVEFWEIGLVGLADPAKYLTSELVDYLLILLVPACRHKGDGVVNPVPFYTWQSMINPDLVKRQRESSVIIDGL